MALAREAIYTALLAKLVGVAGWTTPPTRRLRPVSEVPADQQPTAFLVDAEHETSAHVKGRPLLWTFHPQIVVYARTDDLTTAPGSTINPLLTAIETALEWLPGDGPPAPGSTTTLGGAVLHCRVLDITRGDGIQGGQAVTLITLEVLAPAS